MQLEVSEIHKCKSLLFLFFFFLVVDEIMRFSPAGVLDHGIQEA